MTSVLTFGFGWQFPRHLGSMFPNATLCFSPCGFRGANRFLQLATKVALK